LILEIENLTRIFHPGTPGQITALRSFSLQVKEGDFITLVGPNGSGKTTLLSCIAGSLSCHRGRILLRGKAMHGLAEHERARWISRVFQNPGLGTAPGLTVAENLVLAALRKKRRGLSRGLNRSRLQHFHGALASLQMGLEDRLHAPVGTLSGGQRQALSLLMATIEKPDILLLDEHTASLDPVSAEQIIALSCEMIEKEKLTVLWVTHSLDQAVRLGNRTLVLVQGEAIQEFREDAKAALTVERLKSFIGRP